MWTHHLTPNLTPLPLSQPQVRGPPVTPHTFPLPSAPPTHAPPGAQLPADGGRADAAAAVQQQAAASAAAAAGAVSSSGSSSR